jgi:hypothetical protein
MKSSRRSSLAQLIWSKLKPREATTLDEVLGVLDISADEVLRALVKQGCVTLDQIRTCESASGDP